MNISVCYALPQEQFLEILEMPENTTVEQAIAASKVLEQFPDIDLTVNKVGVFAKLVKLDSELQDHDRVEIYRSLPGKPRNAHAADDKKDRIRAKREKRNTD
ncbi:MAG: RnfH family protein [Zetaproteobacteria bacterium CG_4_9_14_3_um_filter_49_83]|nr:MAG: RnfH family protein [Zetaproteobacteria bacterium CG1_02_49_23]PIQ30848.1 MAG: RnfH family protein [Zetaproteobacteria bacterium CG17_big_fil_post_rev_8_21_14_2_50_50_13]PIV30748.1 MAG: RnfH family protein [Zetaproteobacteria bacterium CG02_land_8_20_14_3_00_50_9]PIY56104.1 MAG: RnfH family protein [Zetaproteobacteria bacterium CG_4_10_14_0_8_um_filter_49_80]PJA34544.1 MAG: RnfH family protein [Zetaproteobacteria bacterium CG_4_9_14_3_um_filter_49_83]